ncbi:MAG: hypothetical protein IGBAC_1059 [Ignavibacteriae bacterium]|nr:MAG: hypothetical protein IGBAC_1059 [Ignavibacteriota bacterium]
MKWIEYKEIVNVNGFSELFIDYLYDFKKVQQYFEYDFRDSESYKVRCEFILQNYKLRNEIYDILLQQNRDFDCGEKTLINLTKLKDDNTFAVVTGQQVGILGGPLYTFYKIISLIKLVEQLNIKFQGYNFIPFFWLESEDHDFEEVNKVTILNPDNQIRKIEYLHKSKSNQHGSVGSYRFENIEEFIAQMSSSLPNSEFKQEILNLIHKYYYNGNTFEKAFVKFYNEIFSDAGIIFISTNDKNVKNLLKNIFKKELESYPKSCQLIIDISAKLEENYHSQIKPKPINLFMHYKDGRYLVEPKNEGYSLKGSRKFYTKAEMEEIIENSPELLSPNVVLRPICQDYLLPTVAYVAGPSEIAYFAQLKPVYRDYGIQMPVIFPRASATILEDKIMRILEKYEIDVISMMKEPEKISQHVIDIISEIKIDSLFNDCTTRISDTLNELKFGLDYIDHTLLGSLETTRQKIIQHLNVLKDKTHLAQRQKYEIALRQVEKAQNNILPEGDLQERSLNLINYLNKYGLNIYKKIIQEIDIENFMHQIIELT